MSWFPAFQYDTRGRNFLHTALMKVDVESVLFLIGVHVNVNSLTTDASRLSPLHLAVQSGNDFIIRNLVGKKDVYYSIYVVARLVVWDSI